MTFCISTERHDVEDRVSVASIFKIMDAHIENVLDGGVSEMLRRWYASSMCKWDASGSWDT